MASEEHVHFVPAVGQCQLARITSRGGVLTVTARDDAGQRIWETRDWSLSVVDLDVDGDVVAGCPYYWDPGGETTVQRSWHDVNECDDEQG